MPVSPFARAVEEGLTGAPQQYASYGGRPDDGALLPDATSGHALPTGPVPARTAEPEVQLDAVAAARELRTAPPADDRAEFRVRAQRGREDVDWAPVFLDALSAGHTVLDAALMANTRPSTVYDRRRNNKYFAAAWREAANLATSLLEEEGQRRAYHGVLEEVRYKGEVVGTVRKYSDALLMFMLRARRPEKYRDGADDGARGNVQINISVDTVAAHPGAEPTTIVPAPPLPPPGDCGPAAAGGAP